MSSERYPLRQVILDDLTSHNKVAILLLLMVVASAIATVWVTHKTRLLIAQENHLSQQNEKLENEYIHQQLEEQSLSGRDLVEGVATKLGLQAVQKAQEIILVR